MESSSSMYSSQNQQAKKSLKQSQSLHSVRKSQLKQSKKPIAPLPPIPPKVYQVDPINFKDLVQKLTGADDDDSIDESLSRLHRAAPPPLHILDRQPQPAAASMFNSALYREMVPDQKSTGFLELNLLSPSCCYFPLLSPGTLSTLD